VQAAVALFTERGFDATTAEDIAEVAECSRSTLFRYFGTKEDILFGEVQAVIAEVRAALAAQLPCEHPWQVAKEVALGRFVEFLSTDSVLPRECINLWFSHPVPLNRYLAITHEWETLLIEFFAAARGPAAANDLVSQLQGTMVVAVVRSVMRAYSTGADLRSAIGDAFTIVEAGSLTRSSTATTSSTASTT
jgi:AcrR family transcriptional regulator